MYKQNGEKSGDREQQKYDYNARSSIYERDQKASQAQGFARRSKKTERKADCLVSMSIPTVKAKNTPPIPEGIGGV
ncbi:MAG: hypothetical protein VB055_11165 [Oscillospiraceae bacterium]|nr:hypothetical protein [Oscillospiraceae bacterium]